MIHYRFYFLDDAGRIMGVNEHEAADDLSALEAAQKVCRDHPVEIWDGARRVAQLTSNGDAPIFIQDTKPAVDPFKH